jgi:hypothetical protein
MTWPHQREFRGRALLFWGLSLAALLRAQAVPGASDRQVFTGALVAAAVCLVIYAYVLALGHLEARFRHLHPRKFRLAHIGCFYLFGGLACGLLAGGPWRVAQDRNGTPGELMAGYLAVPCLLAAAAAACRVLERYRLAEGRSG